MLLQYYSVYNLDCGASAEGCICDTVD